MVSRSVQISNNMSEQNPISPFKPGQIVCIDALNNSLPQSDRLCLFAETIETILIDARCWVQPLAIAKSNSESFELEFLHDLRDTAQLILPIDLFRYALDTEVLPLTSHLFDPTKELIKSPNAQRILYQFITDLYRNI